MNARRAVWMLVISTIIWGSAYLFMKLGLESLGPFNIVALRFGLAFLLLGFTLYPRRKHLTKRLVRNAALLGAMIAAIAGCIATGLQTTTSSNAGFLVGLTVIFVPLIEAAVFRKRPQWRVGVGVVLALCGIALLTYNGTLSLNPGDALCALSGFLYAIQVLITDRAVAGGDDGYCIGVLQMGFAAAIGLIVSLLLETPALPSGAQAWLAVVGLGVLCSAIGFVAPPIAQKYIPPAHAGLIFSLEPLASAVLGAVFLHEVLPATGYAGGVLLLLGVGVSQLDIAALRRRTGNAQNAENQQND